MTVLTDHKTLYQQAVDISTEFLGPAGERFIRRQISTHLGINPENLQSKHLDLLVDWVKLTFALLTEDYQHVDAFADKLYALKPMIKQVRTKYGNSK